MPVIPFIPSDSLTQIFSVLRLSATHLALAVSALQRLKSGTLSLHLPIPVPVLTPCIVTSRPTTASRHSNPLNPSSCASDLAFDDHYVRLKTIFTYLWTQNTSVTSAETVSATMTGYHIARTTFRDRPKRLILVTAVTETGAEIQLLVLAITVTRPKLTNDLRP